MRMVVCASLIVLSGCSSLDRRSLPDLSEAQRASEEMQFTNAQKMLATGKFDQSLILFKEFQGLHPQSLHLQSARLGEAQSLAGMERWYESVEIYRDVVLKTRSYRPEIAAEALYHMSFSYEALGDDLKTAAALLDAKRLGSHLPEEVAFAEVPARLAVVYGRQDREEEALSYLNEAEVGVEKVRAEKGANLPESWLAKTYVQMGGVSANQLSAQSFAGFVRGQKLVQIYLFRAMRLADAVWSRKASEMLQQTYRALYQQFESTRDHKEMQLVLGGELLGLMDQAELFRPPVGHKMNSYESDFFALLSEVRKKTEGVVYGSAGVMGLTEESQRLNSLKRPGRVKVDALLPEEEKSTISHPPKIVPSEDPNL